MNDMVDDKEYDRQVRQGLDFISQFAIPSSENTQFGDVCGPGTLGAVEVQSDAPNH